MNACLALWLAAVTTAAPAQPAALDDERLWSLVLQLGGQNDESAKEQLRPRAVAAASLMLRAAAAAGQTRELTRDAAVGCPGGVFERVPGGGDGTPGGAALHLLLGWAAKDAALLEALRASRDPLARRAALVAVRKSTPAYSSMLDAAERDPDPDVVDLAAALALSCWRDARMDETTTVARYGRLTTQLSKLVKDRPVPGRCQKADEAPKFLERFSKVSIEYRGWSIGNGEAWVDLKSGDSLHWTCALAVYEALAKKSRYEVDLVSPFLDDKMPAEVRAAAAKLAQRDLDNFDRQEKDALNEGMIVAGVEPARKIPVLVPDDPEFSDEKTLEAAARQKAPGAREAIERRVLCRGTMGSGEEIALLGFVPSKRNADDAARIASTCKFGRAGAVAALVRMKDPRAMELLPEALQDHFGLDLLARALSDHWTPQWAARLKALKSHQRSGPLTEALERAGRKL